MSVFKLGGVFNTEQPIYSRFPITGASGVALITGEFQWGFGNGNRTPNGMGLVLPFDCELVSLHLSIEQPRTASVEAYRNASATGRVVATNSSMNGSVSFEDDLVSFNLADTLNFRTITAEGGTGGGIVTAWFRRRVR